MAKGYLRVGIDEFGNYSLASDGNKNGGPAKIKGSVAIRGPGDGKSATDYVYQTGVNAADPLYAASFLLFTQRFPDSTSSSYRRIKIVLTAGSSLGANKGFKISVILYKGGATVTALTLINNFDYPFIAPANLQFGMAASTGSNTDFHEIRNMNITATNTGSFISPTIVNDNLAMCTGEPGILDVTANDVSNNSNGVINKTTVDLNPATPGIQTTFSDPGKGAYTVNQNGIVSFLPVSGFSGNSLITYLVSDTYGSIANSPATITVNVNDILAPSLTMADPVGVCAPTLVDITSASLKSNTTSGATYNYFNSLSNANNNTGNINATAASLSSSGIYYVRAFAAGCATIKPVTVDISATPTVANAGADQNFCLSTGAQATTFLSNNPDIGSGTWSQVSGPGSATISLPNSSNTPVSNMQKGLYTFRWSITNGACSVSADDLVVRVGIVSVAGNNQRLANATTATLQGNDASPGTGSWSQQSGPPVTINAPANAQSTLSGLTPGNTYTFRWTVTNGTCNSVSNLTITDVLNTQAYAGADQMLNNVNQVSITGNTPDANNTGVWTLVSSPSGSTPVISQPANPTTTITSLNYTGDYVFRWTITNGAFSTTDDITISVLSVLPVTFISFTGTADIKGVKLTWQTAIESENDYFIVERSSNGIDFHGTGTVKGKGMSQVVNNYSYTDPILETSDENLFYRLKQVDKDGGFLYSKIVKVLRGSATAMKAQVWPNPFVDHVNVKVYFSHAGTAEIRLYDNDGKLLKQLRQQVVEGYNEILVDRLQANASGLYILEVDKDKTKFRQKLRKE